jgi:pimeloyl-ACP methyl ester carboxylesterase
MLKPTATAIRDTMIGTPVEAFKNQQAMTLQNMVTAPADQATVLDWSMTSDRRVLAQSFYEDLTLDLRPDVAAITTPTTLIYPVSAGQNVEATDAIYKSNYATKPAVTFTRIDNSRHFIMLDQREAFYEAMDAALR